MILSFVSRTVIVYLQLFFADQIQKGPLFVINVFIKFFSASLQCDMKLIGVTGNQGRPGIGDFTVLDRLQHSVLDMWY